MSKNTSILCKNVCFFSLQNSPDIKKSPLFDFSTSPNRVFLHVPAKTAALLLEAAVRIQKPKTQIKNPGFGLFGSVLKRLKLRNVTQKLKNSETGEKNAEKIASVSSVVTSLSSSSSSSSSSNSCRRASSLNCESCSSGRLFDDEEDDDDGFEFMRENHGDYGGICLSPLSPFRFALHKSPSPDRRSTVLSSPAKSPVCCKFEENEKNVQESSVKMEEEEDEEDKEQNSPVSVLDPPFEDDHEGHEEDTYDLDSSYAFVQRTKQQLLQKLHRFEKLAGLDPIELEKRMIEEEEEEEEEEEDLDEELAQEYEQRQVQEFIEDITRKSGFKDVKKSGIKRLISDLMIEEESQENALNYNVEQQLMMKRVCKRLELWKEVESNTIDMMVEMDLRRETCDWKKPQNEVLEAGIGVEVAIFTALVEELVKDLA